MPDDYAANNTNDEHLLEGESIIEPQVEDNAMPFSPPSSPVDDATVDPASRAQSSLDPTHQAADNATDIDSHQLYDEGLSGAAEAGEPNANNSVVDYDPSKDQRQNESTDK